MRFNEWIMDPMYCEEFWCTIMYIKRQGYAVVTCWSLLSSQSMAVESCLMKQICPIQSLLTMRRRTRLLDMQSRNP